MNELSTLPMVANRALTRPVKATKFVFFETGAYDNQYRRPYTTVWDEGQLDVFKESLQDNSSYTPQALVGLANSFLTQQSTPELDAHGKFRSVVVPNGWGERRCRFMIEFEFETAVGNMVLKEVLTGYTSAPDAHTMNSRLSIDPNLDFYVNSTVTVRNRLEYGAGGGGMFYSGRADNSHLLAASAFPDQANTMYRDGDRQHYMRPYDVFATMQVNQVKGYGDYIDSRTTGIGQSVVKSRRSNGVAAEYMGKVLNSMNSANKDEHMRANQHANTQQAARAYAKEHTVSNDTVLKLMADRRGTGASNHFIFRELQELCPNIFDVAEFRISTPTQRVGGHNPGDTQHWGGSDDETQAATILSQSTPAIMSDLLLTRMVCNFNNWSIGGEPVFTFSKALSFVNSDHVNIIDYINLFEQRMINLVLFEISQQGWRKYSIDIDCDLYGETVLTIQFDDQEAIQFCTPSFADALFAPVVTVDQQRAETVANDFQNLMTAVLPDQEQLYGTPVVTEHKQRSF